MVKPTKTDAETKLKSKPTTLNILTANVEGLRTKKTELKKLFHDKNVHIALLQETQHKSCDTTITGYTAYPCQCDKCRGVITYIRNDVQGDVTPCTADQPNDIQLATVWFGERKLKVHNVYSSPKETFTFSAQDTIFKNTVLAGDFNGHSPLWGYADTNASGTNIENLCQSTNLICLQDENSPPTLLHKVHGTQHRPDLTLVSADLQSLSSTEVLKDISSDHRPILLRLDIARQKGERKRKTRWNFKKANWNKFQTEMDASLPSREELLNMDTNQANDSLTAAILTAAKQSIPRGSIKNFKPFWNEKLEQAVQARQEARETYENERTPENRTSYHKAMAEAKLITKASKKDAWTEKCENLDLQSGGREAWQLLQNLSGGGRKVNPKPFTDDNLDVLTSDKKKAEHLNKFFASVSKSDRKSTLDRELKKNLRAEERSAGHTPEAFTKEITTGELEKALHLLKARKAPGPDKVHNEMLKRLSKNGKEALLLLINKTWSTGEIPYIWRVATITPILKKGKKAELPQSYRPISQTSCIGKVAERVINKRLYWWLEMSNIISHNQAGFRAKCRTEDQLFRLTQKIYDGFQQEKHTSAVFVDLQQAYDRVWRSGLLQKMRSIGIRSNMYDWIKSFLTNRLIQTRYNTSLSSKATQEEGLPQGSSLSCTLFLIFLNDVSDVLKCEKALFADDLVFWHTSKSTIISQRRLQEDLTSLEMYCKYWKLKVNATKTVYTIFTKSHKVAKAKMKLQIDGNQLEKDENPTYLGITLDRQLNLNKHVENTRKKATKRLNLIKQLASTTWGADKDTLRTLYLGYTRSVIDYNIALQNTCSPSTKSSLDKVQNQALRLICGGMRSTPTAACEIASNIEPLEIRRKKAALQLYERAKRMEDKHPCKTLVENWKQISRLKQKSVLHVVEELKTRHHLPENRESMHRVNKFIPPFFEMTPPIINKSLPGNINKSSDPNILKMAALEVIDSYPKDSVHVYTDGSAFKATINAGYGVRINYPNGNKTELYDSCGAFSSNYTAEQKAIEAAVGSIEDTFNTTPELVGDVVIFTDSLSALQALESGKYENKEMSNIAIKINQLIQKNGITITLQWIPGHSGIAGNEDADSLAKQGAAQPQPDVPVDQETATKIIKSNFKEEWLNDWSTNKTGRSLYNHMTCPKRKDPIQKLKRREQSTIFRLRTGHVQLNGHLSRIKKNHPPHCPLCGYKNETVEHHLIYCTGLKDLRETYLPIRPSISNTLYSEPTQLSNTCSYFYLASGRRAGAHVPLVG